MTGEEKIEALLKLIDYEFHKLIRGNVIELDSPSLERLGITTQEQSIALDVLANDYRCIEYTAKSVFDSESSLTSNDLRDILEISSINGLSQEEIKQSFLELMTYKITILDNFYDITAKLSKDNIIAKQRNKNIAELSFNKSSKTLRITYNGISKNLKTFRSLTNINYLFLNALLNSPDRPLSRRELRIDKYSTHVKDLPKTAGFTGALKSIFFDIDSKNQTLTLHPKKLLNDDEAEIINSIVNTR